jgi:hypothetical protein
MVHMKIEVYPSLWHALESLGQDELLYTKYFLVKDPLTIKYERRVSGYRPVRFVKRRKLKEVYGSDSGTFGGANPFEDWTSFPVSAVELNESSSSFEYNYFLFRREVLGELAEVLTSAVNKNSKVFEVPLKEAITLGINEINREDKDFICLGIIPNFSEYSREKEIEIIDRTREPIILAMEEESWRKDFLDFGKVREEVENWFRGLLPNEGTYDWVEMIRFVDKELGGGRRRVLADFWEKDRILGVHSGNSGKIKELNKFIKFLKNEFGEKYVREVFPEVLGDIYLYTKLPSKKSKDVEMVSVPLRLRDTGAKGDKEVEFLVLVKLKIEDKVVEWNTLNMKYEYRSIEAEPSRGQFHMKVLSPENAPVRITKDRRKKNIILKSELEEIVKVDTRPEYRNKLGNLNEITYTAKVESFVKYLDIDTENFPELVVEGYGDVGSKKTIEESINFEVFLGEDIDPRIKGGDLRRGPKCLGESSETLINKETRELIKTLLHLGKREIDQEKKDILKLAVFVVTKALEIFNKEEGVDRECGSPNISYRSYYYKLYPKGVKGYIPLIERETMSSILNKNPLSSVLIKRIENIVNFLGSEGGGRVCFSSGGERVEINFEELDRKLNREGELFYLNLLSTNFAKMLSDYIGQLRKVGGKEPRLEEGEDLKDIDEFSISLSGSLLSSIKKFPSTDKQISSVLERIYFYVFQALTFSSLRYDNSSGIWMRKSEKPVLNIKELARFASGVFINLGRIVEEIRLIVTYEYDRKDNNKALGKEARLELQKKVYLHEGYSKSYPKRLVSLYINSDVEDKLVKIYRSLDNFNDY